MSAPCSQKPIVPRAKACGQLSLSATRAAPAFDMAMRVRTTPDLPLVQVDVYASGEPGPEASPPTHSSAGSLMFEPVLAMESFAARVRAAQHRIAEGDIYRRR